MNEQSEKIKKISVSIGGISYQLVSRENETYTREIARKADEMIRQMIQQHPSLSTMQAIILSMVNTIDALTKISGSLDEAKKGVETIESRSVKEMENLKFKMTKAQHELFLLRDTDFELRKEVLRINELNKQLELEIASLRQQKTTPDSSLFERMDSDTELENAVIAFSGNELETEDADEPAGLTDLEEPADSVEFNELNESDDLNGSGNGTENREPEDVGAIEDFTGREEPEGDGATQAPEMDETEETEEGEEILEIVEWAEDDVSQNPFAVPVNNINKSACAGDSYSGFRQPSLEDLFSE